MAPFCAIELKKSTMTRIQKTRDVSPSRTEAPGARVGPAGRGARPLADEARDRRQADRQHHRRRAPRNAVRQPTRRDERLRRSAAAPSRRPRRRDITSASAMPRRRSNQLETAREYAICAVPLPTTPRTKKTA